MVRRLPYRTRLDPPMAGTCKNVHVSGSHFCLGMAMYVPLWKPCGLCRRLAGGSHCQFREMARDGAVAIVTYKVQIKLMFCKTGE